MYPFWSMGHFLDLQYSSKDHNLKSKIFEDLVEEGYYISKYTNTSYTDILKMTSLERRILIKLISDDIKARNEAHEQAMKSIKEM